MSLHPAAVVSHVGFTVLSSELRCVCFQSRRVREPQQVLH